jgi:hypothetical protein
LYRALTATPGTERLTRLDANVVGRSSPSNRAQGIVGKGWFLLDVQSHKLSTDPKRVEGGQLLAMFVDPDIGHAGHNDDDEDYDENDR